jgi:3-phenylpropionate/cinnamic acid dioxygenase small subunit
VTHTVEDMQAAAAANAEAELDDVQTLVAVNEIRNLLALYPQYADDKDVEQWSELFAEDGILRFGATRLRGRQELAGWLTECLQGPSMRHLMVNATIFVDSATTAHGTVDMVLLSTKDGAWTVSAAPRYADRFVKTTDGWRFAERAISMRNPRT